MIGSLTADVRSIDDAGDREDLLHKKMHLELVANTVALKDVVLPSKPWELIAVGAENRLTTGVPGNHVIVYRGELRAAPSVDAKVHKAHKVVVKLATRARSFEALIREGELYAGPLAEMSNRAVPSCYGVFRVTNRTVVDDENDCSFGCLILADLGEPVESFAKADEMFQIRLVNVLVELHHKMHMTHGQVYPVNVFDKNGWPFLVDFSRAKLNHQCKFLLERDALKEFGLDVKPKFEDLPCKELYKVTEAVNGWRPSSFICYNLAFDVEFLESPLDIMDKAPPEFTAEDAFEDAHEAIIKYYNKWMPATGKGKAHADALEENRVSWLKEFKAERARASRG
ncbi:hypothetical protein PENSPDRAFT_756926 [Peniophora sp. CONT]|nr:hypothetical protein PENSPDRAFT_756926 [Peniophora sp. CONT]